MLENPVPVPEKQPANVEEEVQNWNARDKRAAEQGLQVQSEQW